MLQNNVKYPINFIKDLYFDGDILVKNVELLGNYVIALFGDYIDDYNKLNKNDTIYLKIKDKEKFDRAVKANNIKEILNLDFSIIWYYIP